MISRRQKPLQFGNRHSSHSTQEIYIDVNILGQVRMATETEQAKDRIPFIARHPEKHLDKCPRLRLCERLSFIITLNTKTFKQTIQDWGQVIFP